MDANLRLRCVSRCPCPLDCPLFFFCFYLAGGSISTWNGSFIANGDVVAAYWSGLVLLPIGLGTNTLSFMLTLVWGQEQKNWFALPASIEPVWTGAPSGFGSETAWMCHSHQRVLNALESGDSEHRHLLLPGDLGPMNLSSRLSPSNHQSEQNQSVQQQTRAPGLDLRSWQRNQVNL